MNRIRSLLLLALVPAALPAASPAAPPAVGPGRSLHDPTGYALVWNQPGAASTLAREAIVFGRPVDRDLALDLYLPAGLAAGERRPAVVFLSGFGDDPASPLKSWEIYRSWMRTVAARGFVGVMGESDPRDVAGSLAALFRFLESRGGELGVDATRLAAWACSANVGGALPFLMGEGAPRGVVAAVLLYGAGEAPAVRAELPVMLVVAGRDAPALVEAERALAGSARAAGAPWTVVEAPRLPHAFDAFDRSAESLAAVAEVLGFLDAHLVSPPAPAAESAERRAAREALAQLYGRDFEAAHEYYNGLAEEVGAGDRQVWENLAWARRGMNSAVGEMLALEQAVGVAPEDLGLRRRFTRLAARLGGWTQVAEGLAPIESSPEADAIDLGSARPGAAPDRPGRRGGGAARTRGGARRRARHRLQPGLRLRAGRPARGGDRRAGPRRRGRIRGRQAARGRRRPRAFALRSPLRRARRPRGGARAPRRSRGAARLSAPSRRGGRGGRGRARS